MLSAAIALFLLPHIGQNTIDEEDAKFRAYLDAEGYDVSQMGIKTDSSDHITRDLSGESNEKYKQEA